MISHKFRRDLNKDHREEFREYTKRRTLKGWTIEDKTMLCSLYAHCFAIQYTPSKIEDKVIIKIDERLEKAYNKRKKI